MKTRNISDEEVTFHIEHIKAEGYSIIKSYTSDNSTLESALEKIWDNLKNNTHYRDEIAPLGIQNIIREDISINCLTYYNQLFINLSTLGDHLKIYKYFLNDPFYKLVPDEDCNFILAQLNARGGKVALPFHVDSRMVTPGFQTWTMQGYLAVNEISSSSGGLLVRPRSHLLNEFPNSEKFYKDSIELNLKPGDFVVFSSQLHHATSENKSNSLPWTILFTYRCWWCKPQYLLNKLISEENWNLLTPNQKMILGEYSMPNSTIYSSASSRHGY